MNRKQRRVLPQTPWAAPALWCVRAGPLTVLLLALALFGVGEGMLVHSALGSTPWTVLAQGLARQTGWNLGWLTLVISVAVMLLWIPLRLRPGLGTLLNVLVIAWVLGMFVHYVPAPAMWLWRIIGCLLGVVVIGAASALYLTCHLGAGPRDGLMVGLCARTGWRVGAVRSGLEGSVCLVGWLLGGTVGVGTLLFAFGVGWVVQAALALLARRFAALQPPEAA